MGKDTSNNSSIVAYIRCRGNVLKYAVEMGSGAMIYIQSFIKIGSGIQKLTLHRQQGDLISLSLLFQNKESRLKILILSFVINFAELAYQAYTVFLYECYLSICGCTALCRALAAFSVSCPFTQPAKLLGRGISPSQGRYLHTEQHKHRINALRHPCLK
jgi:hypothetical protein